MLELDCHLTKDNQAVVHHDFALNRTTGELGFIRDIEYDVGNKVIINLRDIILSFLEITKN